MNELLKQWEKRLDKLESTDHKPVNDFYAGHISGLKLQLEKSIIELKEFLEASEQARVEEHEQQKEKCDCTIDTIKVDPTNNKCIICGSYIV